MKITSSSFENNEKIPIRFTKDGENINPELRITDIPEGAVSLVLIVDDPDAQRVAGFTWVHWVVFNIPVKDEKEIIIKQSSMPGLSGESTYKKPEYGGPNPPAGSGIHHYHFRVYALGEMLDLRPGASLKDIEEDMEDEILESTELIGIYTRD